MAFLPLGSFWKRFIDLIPKPAKRVVTIVGIYPEGRYLVELLGGDNMNVLGAQGQYTLGDKVFLVDNVIEGKAPSLPTLVIDV